MKFKSESEMSFMEDSSSPGASSTGDRVSEEEEFEPEPKTAQSTSRKKKPWTAKETKQLVRSILSQTNGTDQTPFNEFEINWESIESNQSVEACQRKWNSLLSKTRHYRTLMEVGTEMLLRHEASDATVLEWNKKTKPIITTPKPKKSGKSSYPAGYPKKPQNAYNLFTVEHSLKLREEGVSSKDWFYKISQVWKQMDARQRQQYLQGAEKKRIQYLKDLEEYAKKNPDDKNILEIIKTEKASHYKKKPSSTNLNDSDVSGNHIITEYMVPDKDVDQVPDSDNSDLQESTFCDSALDSFPSISPSPKKKKMKREVNSSPEKSSKKRKDSEVSSPEKSSKKRKDSEVSSPEKSSKKRKAAEDVDASSPVKSPKKKKKKLFLLSGVDMFIESKKESYQLSHPDMDDETVSKKLKGKFTKLSDKKQEKYEKLAAQRNESG